jgi:hypothetical protein
MSGKKSCSVNEKKTAIRRCLGEPIKAECLANMHLASFPLRALPITSLIQLKGKKATLADDKHVKDLINCSTKKVPRDSRGRNINFVDVTIHRTCLPWACNIPRYSKCTRLWLTQQLHSSQYTQKWETPLPTLLSKALLGKKNRRKLPQKNKNRKKPQKY